MKMHKQQWAVKFVGPDQIVIDSEHPVPPLGPTHILVEIESCGICFSDTKLLHAFDRHPRKSEVVGGISQEQLEHNPSYVPGTADTVPGHEPVGHIVQIGDRVQHYSVGDRVLVQADWKHLPTARSNGAFGYNFQGGLQQYVLIDEHCVVDEDGEKYLLPVSEGPSAAAVGLVEPWATVEGAYSQKERSGPLAGGRMLIVIERPTSLTVVDEFVEKAAPESFEVIDLLSEGDLGDVEETFDDVIYLGSNPVTIEELGWRVGAHGLMNVVLGDEKLADEVGIDVGRVHYDAIRYVGTTGCDIMAGYQWIPANDQLPTRGRVLVVGAAGPMGTMHMVRALSLLDSGSELVGSDVNDERLQHLERIVAEEASSSGITLSVVNTTSHPLTQDFDYVVCLVPVHAVVREAIASAAHGSIVNIFAGIPAGKVGPVDLQRVIENHIFIVGSSGSSTDDMRVVLSRIENEGLDSTIVLDAVCGMAGFPDAIKAVDQRTSQGKIMVYPHLPTLRYLPLSELQVEYPTVAALMENGRWTAAAEQELLNLEAAKESSLPGGESISQTTSG